VGPWHVRARIGFPDDLVEGSAPEKTTRGRSFLFFALAALAASVLRRLRQLHEPTPCADASSKAIRCANWSSFIGGIVTAVLAGGPYGDSVAKGMKKISYNGYRFPPEIAVAAQVAALVSPRLK